MERNRALKSLKNFHFNRLLFSKVYTVWTKKLESSYLPWQWRVMQNLKKNLTCCLENDMTNLAIFHQSTWKCQNWYLDAQSRKNMTLKFTEQLCVMTMKNDTKTEEELTCRFKIDMMNFTNFDPSTRKSKKFVLIGSLWPKYILF